MNNWVATNNIRGKNPLNPFKDNVCFIPNFGNRGEASYLAITKCYTQEQMDDLDAVDWDKEINHGMNK